jgi:hypothetical protein
MTRRLLLAATTFLLAAAAILLALSLALASHDDAPTAFLEAEAGAISPGFIAEDVQASDRRYARLPWNGVVAATISAPDGASGVAVRARGESCEGPPRMVVSVDGRELLSADVDSETWDDYAVNAELAPGDHHVVVAFVNDRWAGCDRNLAVDEIQLLRAPVGARVWTGDMEEGTLADWRRDEGGGVYNSGGGEAEATDELARSGSWAARLALPDGAGGARLFRWREPRLHRRLIYSARFRFPQSYTLTGDPDVGRYLVLLQFKSRAVDGITRPIWYLDVQNPEPGRMRLDLVWWHRSLEGPRPGESGFRRFRQTVADVPVGRWFEVRAELRESKDFDGRCACGRAAG